MKKEHAPKAVKCAECGEIYDHVFTYGGQPPYAGYYANCETHGPIKIPKIRYEACVNGCIPEVSTNGANRTDPRQGKITEFVNARKRRGRK